MEIEVILGPAEFPALSQRDLGGVTCVVFDVLRATSSMLTAMNNGAEAIIPVAEISEALALKERQPAVLLAGERHGLRIGSEQTGGVEFDFGNSPRDFAPEKVGGKTIAWTTTNGTRALRSCAHAEMVLVGALLNLRALADALDTLRPPRLLLVCAGTFEAAAFEDMFAAGALIDRVRHLVSTDGLSDAAQVVWRAFRNTFEDHELIAASLNARRLLANANLAPDVALCLRRDAIDLNAGLFDDGMVRPMRGGAAKLAAG
jgi:2-phosphosulfolactate phosphatase